MDHENIITGTEAEVMQLREDVTELGNTICTLCEQIHHYESTQCNSCAMTEIKNRRKPGDTDE